MQLLKAYDKGRYGSSFFAIFVTLMRRICLLLSLFLPFHFATAQHSVKPRLDWPYSIQQLQNQRIESRKGNGQTLMGYRIFMGLSNNRAEALQMQQDINTALGGDFLSEIVYDEPNFKIYIGRYYSQTEVNRALYRIRPLYPASRAIRLPLPAPHSNP